MSACLDACMGACMSAYMDACTVWMHVWIRIMFVYMDACMNSCSVCFVCICTAACMPCKHCSLYVSACVFIVCKSFLYFVRILSPSRIKCESCFHARVRFTWHESKIIV